MTTCVFAKASKGTQTLQNAPGPGFGKGRNAKIAAEELKEAAPSIFTKVGCVIEIPACLAQLQALRFEFCVIFHDSF